MSLCQAPVYDQIGGRYARARHADPRIAEHITEALADASSVVNVGAGSGSYEPQDRSVVAVEPSGTMLAQRPAGSAPAVRATAEALPFAADAFDAALAVLTVHHWSDRVTGLAELRRVARGPVVLFTRDGEAAPFWWLHHYFPASGRLERSRETRFSELAEMLGGTVQVVPVPIPADCTDGFNAAYWRRPGDYLNPEVWRAMSALAMIGEADRAAGMRRLQDDLDSGEWDRRWGHLRSLDELDLGYRLLIARP
jgi:SAM-dependent methyltransferase